MSLNIKEILGSASSIKSILSSSSYINLIAKVDMKIAAQNLRDYERVTSPEEKKALLDRAIGNFERAAMSYEECMKENFTKHVNIAAYDRYKVLTVFAWLQAGMCNQ